MKNSPARSSLPTFALIGARWTAPVVAALGAERLRFGEIERSLPDIHAKSLAATLRALECGGFALRTAFATIPPRVEYELTPLGHDLAKSLAAVDDIAERASHTRAEPTLSGQGGR